MATRFVQSGVAVLLAALCCLGTAPAAELDNLPPIVRMMLEGVEVDWEGLTVTAPEPVTLGPTQPAPLPGAAASPRVAPGLAPLPLPAPQSPGAVSLDRKPIDLGSSGTGTAAVSTTAPAAVPGPHVAGNTPVTLGAADLLPDVIAASALSAARREALVALASTGALSAEEWKDTILRGKFTFDDLCAIWHQFRRDYPQQGESPQYTRRLWHGARDALGLAQVDTATLPIPQLFVLAEMQLYPGETQGAEKCLRALLARLESGEPPGPRVTKGLLAYRIAQCYKQRGETEKAIEWFGSCAEWGAPTQDNPYDVRGEGLVEAARLLRQVGRTEEAEAAYHKAIDSTAGWGKAVALLDCAALCLRMRDLPSGEQYLAQLMDGSQGPSATARAWLILGKLRRVTEDEAGACSAFQSGAEVCRRFSSARPMDDLAHVLDITERELQRGREIHVRPSALKVAAGRCHKLRVASPASGELHVACDIESLDVSPATQRLTAADGGFAAEVEVMLTGGPPRQALTGHIVVKASGDAREVRIPVEVPAAPRAAPVPSEAFLGFVQSGQTATCSVVLRHTEGFRVTSLRPSRADITASCPDGGTTVRTHTLTVTACPREAGSQSGEVLVETSVPHQEVIAIPVYWHCR